MVSQNFGFSDHEEADHEASSFPWYEKLFYLFLFISSVRPHSDLMWLAIIVIAGSIAFRFKQKWTGTIQLVLGLGSVIFLVQSGRGGHDFSDGSGGSIVAWLFSPLTYTLSNFVGPRIIEIFAGISLVIMLSVTIFFLRDSFWRPSRAR